MEWKYCTCIVYSLQHKAGRCGRAGSAKGRVGIYKRTKAGNAAYRIDDKMRTGDGRLHGGGGQSVYKSKRPELSGYQPAVQVPVRFARVSRVTRHTAGYITN